MVSLFFLFGWGVYGRTEEHSGVLRGFLKGLKLRGFPIMIMIIISLNSQLLLDAVAVLNVQNCLMAHNHSARSDVDHRLSLSFIKRESFGGRRGVCDVPVFSRILSMSQTIHYMEYMSTFGWFTNSMWAYKLYMECLGVSSMSDPLLGLRTEKAVLSDRMLGH